jgi:hypothetical protein
VCSIDGFRLTYLPESGDHACPDSTCIWAEGVNAALDAMAEYEAGAWAGSQLWGIPRCVAFPGRGDCCGKADSEGNLIGICPPPER